jgi:hypothetical protein
MHPLYKPILYVKAEGDLQMTSLDKWKYHFDVFYIDDGNNHNLDFRIQ